MNLEIEPFFRGDTVEWELTFTDSFGVPLNIEGWRIYLTFKESRSDPDSRAPLQLRYIPQPEDNPELGVYNLQIHYAWTDILTKNRYFADIQVVTPDNIIKTFDLTPIVVKKDVTRGQGIPYVTPG